MVYWIGHVLFWIFFKSFLFLRAFGAEHIPKESGYVLASNHLSNLDPMILGIASGRRLSYFAKASLFKSKFFSTILPLVGAFPARRGIADPSSIRESIRRLNIKQGLVMFPQGGRQIGVIDPENAKPGVGMIAAKAGVPIVPAYICGSNKAMAPKSKLIKPARVTVYFGSPIHIKQGESYRETAYAVMEAIKELSLKVSK